MERFSFEVTDPRVADALRGDAEAHGRSVETELAELVKRFYLPVETDGPDENWVEDLLRLGRGLNLEVPPRVVERFEPPTL